MLSTLFFYMGLYDPLFVYKKKVASTYALATCHYEDKKNNCFLFIHTLNNRSCGSACNRLRKLVSRRR